MRNRLIRLLAEQRACADRRFEAKLLPAAAGDGAQVEAEIFLYDTIVDSELEAEWWGGVAPAPFVKALKALDADVIHLRINSPGGSVFAARAMETALREHKARIVVHIDALAASAASFLAMAGDEIIISKGAMLMIHKAWTYAWGNAADLTQTAALLEKIDGTLAETYADRSGKSAEHMAELMAAETWFTAAEALDAGLVDTIAEPAGKGDGGQAAAAHWNLSAFEHAPAALQAAAPPPPTAPAEPPAAHAAEDHRHRQHQRLRALSLTQVV